MKGYDPIKLTEKMESIVVDGNKRKYAKLSRPLRFYGGTTSAVEVGCNLRCKFCFSDKPVFRPQSTGKCYSPQEVFKALDKGAKRYGHKLISASASEGTLGRDHLFELLDLVETSDYVYILETNGMTLMLKGFNDCLRNDRFSALIFFKLGFVAPCTVRVSLLSKVTVFKE